MNFAQLAYMEKLKTEPKYPAVKESPLNEVPFTRACLKDCFSFVNQKKCGKPETGGRRWAKTRLKPSSDPGPVHIGGFHLYLLVFPFIYQFYSITTTLVKSICLNPTELFILISFQKVLIRCVD